MVKSFLSNKTGGGLASMESHFPYIRIVRVD